MAYSNGGSTMALIEHYQDGEDSDIDFGHNRYLAQTFTLSSDFVVWRFLIKAWTVQSGKQWHLALKATDGTGKPTGPDLANTQLGPMGEKYRSPGTWRRFDFHSFPKLPAGVYAIVASVPTATHWTTHKWRCDATAPAYTRGKAWLSHNQGIDWVEVPGTDFMFKQWGYLPPPEPPPSPSISNWASLGIAQTDFPDAVTIVYTTDIPCHLFMRWTLVEPQIHTQPVLRRGLLMHTDLRYCFVAWEENEQLEPGDTLTHTFHKANWPQCQTRWFYFVGTVADEQQPSVSPIFKKHKTEYVPTQFFFAYEPDQCSIGTSGAWITVDRVLGGLLKDLLPPTATIAFLHVINDDAARKIGLRPTGSAHNETDDMLEHSHTWAHVALDANNTFEVFLGNHLNQSVYLMGYAIDPAVVMLDNPVPKTLAVNFNWQTFDLSAECPDAIAIFCEPIINIVGEISGFRKHGSTDNRVATLMHNWIVIGCDNTQKIDVRSFPWAGFPGKFYITGYIKSSATFETNGIDQSLPITNSYQTIVVPQSCHLAFYEEYSPSIANKLAMRPYGSAEDIYWKPNYAHICIVGAPNADLKLEGKIENLGTDWFYIGSGT